MAIDQEEDDDGVISRWSKRKRGIAIEAEQEEERLSVEEQQVIDDAYQLELLENRQAAEEIDLETIDEESDISVFMKEGVPEALKKQALAVLWRSNPVFANIDGLNDYDDDFGSSDLIMKTFKSAYQAGRGYLKQDTDLEEETPLAEGEAGVEDEPDVEDEVAQVGDEDDISTDEIQADETTSEEIVTSENNLELEQEETPELAQPKVSLRKRLMQEG